MSNTDKLIRLMTKHRHSRQDIADLLGYARGTVDNWFKTDFRALPDNTLALIEFKLTNPRALRSLKGNKFGD